MPMHFQPCSHGEWYFDHVTLSFDTNEGIYGHSAILNLSLTSSIPKQLPPCCFLSANYMTSVLVYDDLLSEFQSTLSISLKINLCCCIFRRFMWMLYTCMSTLQSMWTYFHVYCRNDHEHVYMQCLWLPDLADTTKLVLIFDTSIWAQSELVQILDVSIGSVLYWPMLLSFMCVCVLWFWAQNWSTQLHAGIPCGGGFGVWFNGCEHACCVHNYVYMIL